MQTRALRDQKGLRFLLVVATLGSGCAGSLHQAAREHAAASRSVAQTVKRVTAGLTCEGLKEESLAACKTRIAILEEQAQALGDSAERLLHATQ
jgi:hypothetical protein